MGSSKCERSAKKTKRVWSVLKNLTHVNSNNVTRPLKSIFHGPRLGNKVVEVENISKSFGDRLLYENLSFTVPPAAIVGIVGPNGAGKTTLFRMMTGEQNLTLVL